MTTLLCIIIFIVLSVWLLKIMSASEVELPMPYDRHYKLGVSGLDGLVILMFATAWVGLSPVLSLRLAFLEVLCVIGLFKCRNNLPFSVPLRLYMLFMIWVLIGIFYTPSANFGVRMVLKYLYPFLFCMLCAKVVRDGTVFLTAGMWARKIGTIVIILLLSPLASILAQYFWYIAATITGLITFIIFSFAMSEFTDEKKKNIWWGILLCLPCILVVFRTDIFGTGVALSAFFFVKYRLKALPFIIGIGLLGLCAMFYIPTVKNKMFIHPDQVTITDYLSGNIDENNVQTNMRKFMWEDATHRFYDGHEIVGSGTGRVQTFFYTEATDSRRGGQLHNDFLVLRCDNGQIGFWLFLLAYFAILLHCTILYRKSDNQYVRMCSLVAGSSLMGVFVTMFSDNTLSYSMVTLSYPWGFYGMALGLKEQDEEEI